MINEGKNSGINRFPRQVTTLRIGLELDFLSCLFLLFSMHIIKREKVWWMYDLSHVMRQRNWRLISHFARKAMPLLFLQDRPVSGVCLF